MLQTHQMNNEIKYRSNGAKAALLDEYERSINDLKKVIEDIAPNELSIIVDPHTKDQDCISIQSILTHVVRAGYTYSIEIRKYQGEQLDYKKRRTLNSAQSYISALDSMFDYCEKTFNLYPDLSIEEYDEKNKMKVAWGQNYDVEQLMEHAIVHILRHRRQIERFKLLLHE